MVKRKQEIVNPMQTRILNRFYTSKFGAIEPPLIDRILGVTPEIQSRWGARDLIENLKVKGEKDKDYFTQSFYDLIKKGLIKADKYSDGHTHSYYMTRKGLKVIKGLEKGYYTGLERYSSENPQDQFSKGKRSKLENIAASIFILFGIILIVQKMTLTGNVIATEFLFNKTSILGGLLITIGTALFFLSKIKI